MTNRGENYWEIHGMAFANIEYAIPRLLEGNIYWEMYYILEIEEENYWEMDSMVAFADI